MASEDSGKFARLREIAETIASRQEKVLVFTQFREITEPLCALLGRRLRPPGPRAARRHGGRQSARSWSDASRRTSAPFFVLSLKAGGTGLNLTAASHVVHFDRWWNPAVENQATDRAFRIGQKRNVLVHKFVCRGTVEERIDALIESKRQLAGELLERRRRDQPDRNRATASCSTSSRSISIAAIEGGRRMSFWGYRPYVPVAERRAKAAQGSREAEEKGRAVSPVVIEGRKIARSFWGKAWCDNLERYRDIANRLPRGRTYVRNGSVVDLQIARGKVEALVSGSELYRVEDRHRGRCAGALEGDLRGLRRARSARSSSLLQGKLSKHVMERVCREADGLFPPPKEIKMSCSCPDWAAMCKHVAAALYGVGARLDHRSGPLVHVARS